MDGEMVITCSAGHVLDDPSPFCPECGAPTHRETVDRAVEEVVPVMCPALHSNPPGAVVCEQCGVALVVDVVLCPAGHSNDPDAMHCSACGAAIGTDEESLPVGNPEPGSPPPALEQEPGTMSLRHRWLAGSVVVGLVGILAVVALMDGGDEEKTEAEVAVVQGQSALLRECGQFGVRYSSDFNARIDDSKPLVYGPDGTAEIKWEALLREYRYDPLYGSYKAIFPTTRTTTDGETTVVTCGGP